MHLALCKVAAGRGADVHRPRLWRGGLKAALDYCNKPFLVTGSDGRERVVRYGLDQHRLHQVVATDILRVPPPVFFGGAGNASKQLNLNAPALINIQPADTRYFQFWYRDPQGGPHGFNLSNGLEITFCP